MCIRDSFLTVYLRYALNTIGLFDLQFTYLQGLVLGQEVVQAAIEQARRELSLTPLFSNLVCN